MLSASIFLSLFTLLFISMGVYYLAKYIKIPYTVLLVLVGVLMIPISNISWLSFLSEFKLTADLLFFIFLPTLIFESAFNLNIKSLNRNRVTIGLLSVLGLLISTFLIALLGSIILPLFGVKIPFVVLLLFGCIVSATDPVAVLAIFKDFGAPKRLALIFEGESLFNDASAYALFTIILGVMGAGFHGFTTVSQGLFSFLVMISGGALVGLLLGLAFSKLIEFIKNNEKVEITLTMIVAHLTFIFTELINQQHIDLLGTDLHFSSIIATVTSSLVIGNFGRYKISPQIEEYMDKFWEYFAFVANSLVFIMMGILFASLFNDKMMYLKPMFIMLVIVTVVRATTIYPIAFLNNKISNLKLPKSWQHLLAFGDLKGALAVIMVLLIPDNLTVMGLPEGYVLKDLLTIMTIGIIFFTLFFKATSLGYIIKKLKINKFSSIEKIEYLESKSLIFSKVLSRLHTLKNKGYINHKLYENLKKNYETKFENAYKKCGKLACKSEKTFLRLLRTYAIGMEKHAFKRLFARSELNEKTYRALLDKLSHQLDLIEDNQEEIYTTMAPTRDGFWEKLIYKLFYGKSVKEDPVSMYMYYRALRVASRKVVEELSSIMKQSHLDEYDHKHYLEDIIETYEKFYKSASHKMNTVLENNQRALKKLNLSFAKSAILSTEEKLLKELSAREMITPKINLKLNDEIKVENSI